MEEIVACCAERNSLNGEATGAADEGPGGSPLSATSENAASGGADDLLPILVLVEYQGIFFWCVLPHFG